MANQPYIDGETAQRVLEEVKDGLYGDLLQGPVYGPHQKFIEKFIYAGAVEYLYNEHSDPFESLQCFDVDVSHAVWELIFDEAPVSTQEALVGEGAPVGIAHDRGLCVREDAERASIDAVRTAVERVVGVDPANEEVVFAEGCMPEDAWRAAYADAEKAAPRVRADVVSAVRARLDKWQLDPGSVTVEGMIAELGRIVD